MKSYCVCRSSDTSKFMICCDECNEWFHGECVQISASRSKQIKSFYCAACRTANPTLQIELKSKDTGEATKATETVAAVRCGQCIGCFRSDDCGRCDVCRTAGGATDERRCRQRICVNAGILQQASRADAAPSAAAKRGRPKTKHASSARPRAAKRANTSGLSGTRRSAKVYEEFMKEAGIASSGDEKGEAAARQCFGPACTLAARKGSKYCSDDCGLALAKARLTQILPGRLHEWNAESSVAQQRQEEQLAVLRERQTQYRQRLAEIDGEVGSLDAWVAAARHLSPCEAAVAAVEDDDDQQSVACVACGMETAVRTAPKHIAKCFAKYEGQTSYGTPFKATSNPYNLFCDTFNKVNKTYCKRLRVICAEHAKDAPSSDAAVCGCPLVWKTVKVPPLSEADGQLCRVPRKRCARHYHWERVARALADMERLSLLLKLDELFDEERSARVAMAARGSVLALLLHQTVAAANS